MVRFPPPPPLAIDPDAPLRRDVDSDDVRRVHPDLDPSAPVAARNAHLERCDAAAYETVRAHLPLFTPPHQRASRP